MDNALKIATAVGIVLLAAVAAVVLLQQLPPSGGELTLGSENITNSEGSSKLLNAATVSIVMDARNISQDNTEKVFNCGIAFARDLGALNKTIVNFALEDGKCIKSDLNSTSITECDALIKESDYIIVVRGAAGEPEVQYYADHFLVEVPENSTQECGITVSEQ